MIETGGGIVLAIPANTFLNPDGTRATGAVQLCVKEALDAWTIMRAGLSTMAGDRPLETGGMFFIDARQGSVILRIDSTIGLYAEVPGDAAKSGMQLFRGQRLPGGRIDWANPVELPRDLVAVDILSLDFYPPGYEAPGYLRVLARNGYPTGSKPFTDSVYYAMAAWFDDDGRVNDDASDRDWDESDTTRAIGRNSTRNTGKIDCGINPAKIKAIWSST